MSVWPGARVHRRRRPRRSAPSVLIDDPPPGEIHGGKPGWKDGEGDSLIHDNDVHVVTKGGLRRCRTRIDLGEREITLPEQWKGGFLRTPDIGRGNRQVHAEMRFR